jgi:hypothetical protein
MLLLVLALASISAAHEEDDASIEELHRDPWSYLGIPDPMNVLFISSFLSGLAIFYSLFMKNASETAKKIVFLAISAPIAFTTIYVVAATILLNNASETEGPVHWHADFEIWACGEKFELINPTGIDNKVGSPTVHEHNDNRMHIEGVLLKKEEASLRNFFIQVGGNFDETSLTLPTNEGVRTWNNGETCNGRPAKWHVFVNGDLLPNGAAHDYVLAPYAITRTQGGDGDLIKMVFSEKNPNIINPELGVEP